jgi:16S rRNA (cytosine967-C5)-methyltransferase
VLEGGGLKGALSTALRDAPGLGGQERRFAAFATRELSRHQRLLDLASRLVGQPPSALALVQDQAISRYAMWRRVFTGEGWKRIGPEVSLPGPVRPRSIRDAALERLVSAELPEPSLPEDPLERAAVLRSFPAWMAAAIARAAEGLAVDEVLAALNVEPSLILRARGDREALISELSNAGIKAAAVEGAKEAIEVLDAGNQVFDSQPMKQGRLQVMDLGSQLIVEQCQAAVGATVIDYCAGAGGKSLMLADRVGPTGKVIATDLSRKRLEDAKKRARQHRLGNIVFPKDVSLASADVVLVDAPCSGSGSLAREPDQKWKLSAKKVDEFRGKQLSILGQVANGVRVGAALVYATCSLLREEDEEVIAAFTLKHPEFQLEGPFLRVWPHQRPGGGFFAARLRKTR